MDGDVFGSVGGMEGGIDGLLRVIGDVRIMMVTQTVSEREGERKSISLRTTSSSPYAISSSSSLPLQFRVDSKSTSKP